MKPLIKSDVTKTLLYLTLTLTATAALAPWLYNAGQIVAEVAELRTHAQHSPGFSGLCAKAGFPWYFLLTLTVVALGLSIPCIYWLRLQGSTRYPSPPWRLQLPSSSLQDTSQALTPQPRRLLVWTTGFLVAGSLMTLMHWLLLLTGWFSFSHPFEWLPSALKSISAAFLLATVIEWSFRGIMLGILLRSLRPTIAILVTAIIFACFHFIIPGGNYHLNQPDTANAGFRFLAGSVLHIGTDPGHLAGFLTMLIAGLILGYSRYRTASLTLPIALQTGWIFTFLLSLQIFNTSHSLTSNVTLFISEDKRSGIIPLCFVIVTGIFIHVFLQILLKEKKRST